VTSDVHGYINLVDMNFETVICWLW